MPGSLGIVDILAVAGRSQGASLSLKLTEGLPENEFVVRPACQTKPN